MQKQFKRILSVILTVVMIIGSSTVAFAANPSTQVLVGPDGKTTLAISANQDKFSWGDIITFDVRVTNITREALTNVQVVAEPKLATRFVKVNDAAASTISVLRPGETQTVQLKYQAKKLPAWASFVLLPLMMLFNYTGRYNFRYTQYNYVEEVKVGIFNFNFGFRVSYGGEAPEEPSKLFFTLPEAINVIEDIVTGTKYVNNEVLLSAAEGISYDRIQQLVNSINGTIVGYIDVFNEYQIRLTSVRSYDELAVLVDELMQRPEITFSSFDYAMNISESSIVPADPWGGNQDWNTDIPEGNNWGVEAINAPQAWEYRDRMNPITIGLIDSGFDTHHEDLTYAWTQSSNVADDHGTHVSGTMAATWNNRGVTGVMPTSKTNGERLVDLIGVSQDGYGFEEWFTFEMKCCYADLILRGTKVINISQGFNWYQPFWSEDGDTTYWYNDNITERARELARKYAAPQENFLKRALDQGYEFVLVCAAGNDSGIDAQYASPMNAITEPTVKDRIIVVGAIGNLGRESYWAGSDEHRGYEVAYFSNLGQRVDVMAPGVDVYSTYTTSSGRYGYMSGTSMAAPHVSGVASIVWSINPRLTGAQVKSIVVGTADRPITYRNRTYNIVNAKLAADEAVDSISAIDPWQPEPLNNGAIISRVYDIRTREAIENAVVSAYAADGTYIGAAETDEHGQFELVLPEGTYTLIAYKTGYIPATQYEQSVRYAQVENTDPFYLTQETAPDTNGVAKGTIFNAVNGQPVPDVIMRFQNSLTGATALETTTNSSGRYEVTLPVGYYNVSLHKTDYISSSFQVAVSNETASFDQNSIISPVLNDDELRIVLTWNEIPRDLDSHTYGKTKNGNGIHVYYPSSCKRAYEDGVTIVDLDIDDTSSYGPETTTIHKEFQGTFTFSVHDFSNLNLSYSTALANSGAQVKVYNGNTLVTTFNVPNRDATLWNVFSYNTETGVITPLNTMEYHADPDTIGQ